MRRAAVQALMSRQFVQQLPGSKVTRVNDNAIAELSQKELGGCPVSYDQGVVGLNLVQAPVQSGVY